MCLPVYQESIVQNVELVTKQTKLESLLHLVRPPLPAESLVVPGIFVGPDEKRLPVLMRKNSLPDVENIQARLYLCLQPLCCQWYAVTSRTDCLVERFHNIRADELH